MGRMSYQAPGWGVMWTLSIGDHEEPMTCSLEVVTTPPWLLQSGKDVEVQVEGLPSLGTCCLDELRHQDPGSYSLAARG